MILSDYIVRATAKQAQIRAFAITSREIVETARQKHNTSPVVTAALGTITQCRCNDGQHVKGGYGYTDAAGKGRRSDARTDGNGRC